MKQADMSRGLKLLFENFWIIREDSPEDYNFLRRHQGTLQKEVRQRFGMNLIIRPQYIQLLKRPHELFDWMGDIGFTSQLDYVLFCCSMAFVEGLEADTPFMLDEMIRDLDLIIPEEVAIDWTNYNHRKSLIRVIKKMLALRVIETIQGETSGFEHSEDDQEILFMTTVQARAFLARAPQSYTQYENFYAFWQDIQENVTLEGNQLIYQRLMMEPIIQRNVENEELFIRLRNYHHYMKEYIEQATNFHLELYRDYVALTLEERDNWLEVFPSRMVIDEVLIQLATLIRSADFAVSSYGTMMITHQQVEELYTALQANYQQYWSKEVKGLSQEQLSQRLLERGESWQLFEKIDAQLVIKPNFGRLIAEMREENE